MSNHGANNIYEISFLIHYDAYKPDACTIFELESKVSCFSICNFLQKCVLRGFTF